MIAHDRRYAPGSTSNQWDEWLEDVLRNYGSEAYQAALTGEDADKIAVSHDHANFWLAIADCDYKRAERHGEVPDEWRMEAIHAQD